MALSTRVDSNIKVINNDIKGEILEKVILHNDLSKLSPTEKVKYVTSLCHSLGLNPLTKPIQIIKDKKDNEKIYFGKETTEQLRTIHNISIYDMKSQLLGDNYVVTSFGKTPDGRIDSSTGVVNIKGKMGEDVANAMMKAETKSKRRLTLSICGLGFMDESEVESIKDAVRIDPYSNQSNINNIEDRSQDLELVYSSFLDDLMKADSIDRLQEVFLELKKANFKDRPDLFKILVETKDIRKQELSEPKEISDEVKEIISEM